MTIKTFHSSLGSQVKAKAACKMLGTNGNGMLDGNEAFDLFRNMPPQIDNSNSKQEIKLIICLFKTFKIRPFHF